MDTGTGAFRLDHSEFDTTITELAVFRVDLHHFKKLDGRTDKKLQNMAAPLAWRELLNALRGVEKISS